MAKTNVARKEETEDVTPQSTSLTPEERAIFNRVASASDEWKDELVASDMNEFSLMEDPFKLPEPARRLEEQRRFKFRWITRTPQRLDEMMNKNKVMRWYPVNSTSPTGDFAKLVNPNNGAVCREDQMLVFKRYEVFELEQKMKHSRDPKDPLEHGENFSKATRKLTDKEAKREEVKGGDIQFKGEAEVDDEQGVSISDGDDVLREEV